MSDEAAFLEALKANPADDTTRLVYADWLDERNEPEKAEYLRLVAKLASTSAVIDPEATTVRHLCVVEERMPRAWREVVAGRFDLILHFVDPTQRATAINRIREVSGVTLAGAKRIAQTVAGMLVFGCLAPILGFRRRFSHDDAVRLGIQPSRHPSGLVPRLFYPILGPWAVDRPDRGESFLGAIRMALGDSAVDSALHERINAEQVMLKVPVSVHQLFCLADRLGSLQLPLTEPHRRYIDVVPTPQNLISSLE